MRRGIGRVALLISAGLLIWRQYQHLTALFFHNWVDTFIDIVVGVSAALMVANALGFRHIVWWRTVGPCLTSVVLLWLVAPFFGLWRLTPGYRLTEWAEQSPWYGSQHPYVFMDVDPWMSLAVNLLFCTAGLSLLLVVGVALGRRRRVHVRAA